MRKGAAFIVSIVGISMCSVAASCLDFGDLTSGSSADGGGDGPCDCGDASGNTDGTTTTGNDGSTTILADGGCPTGLPGPSMIAANGYCIDSTEVTVAQYMQFLEAGAPSLGPPLAKCAWNTSFAPEQDGGKVMDGPGVTLACYSGIDDPTARGDYPISCIDWCDAWSFCDWSGKRLCGAIGDGDLDVDASVSNTSQWYVACATPADLAYPTGASYPPGACYTGTSLSNFITEPVASYPKCIGGYPGLYDMAGNVEEWIDACDDSDPTKPQNDSCVEMSSACYDVSTESTHCDEVNEGTRSAVSPFIGFRCCSK
jgi:formylglycine-generating enzyme required for sulfatase activity